MARMNVSGKVARQPEADGGQHPMDGAETALHVAAPDASLIVSE